MSLDGVWKIEMLGPYGWEGMATAFLHDGRYWAGSADHHSIGSYREDADTVTVETETVAHESQRAMFGKRASEYRLRFEGHLVGDTMDGHAKDTDGGFLVHFRARRIADLS